MKERVFIDTNVLFYLHSKDDVGKRDKVINVLNDYECVVSTQVLSELCNILVKKVKLPMAEVKTVIEVICMSCVLLKIDRETLEQALELHNEYKYSYYDCVVVRL